MAFAVLTGRHGRAPGGTGTETGMGRTLYIHIGHYKTGTTALQVFLRRNADLLARQGLRYPDLHEHNGKHSALAFSILKAAGVDSQLYGYDRPESPESLWSALFEALRAGDEPAMLVSSEEFIRFGAYPGAVRLLREIVAGAPDIDFRIIAYLRAPDAHLRSWYNQLVKMRMPVGPFNHAVRHQMELVHLDYGLALAPWIEVFGPECVTLRPFVDELRYDGAIFADFMATLGMKVPPGADLPGGDPNPRLDPALLELARWLNAADVPRHVVRSAMERAAAHLAADGAAQRDEDADFAPVQALSAAGLQALAALPGNGVDIDAFTRHLPQPDEPQGDGRDQAMGFVVRDLMEAQHRLRKQLNQIERRLAALEPTPDDGQGTH